MALQTIQIESGSQLFHCSDNVEALIANGFDPQYANPAYYGAFHFADEEAAASNCKIEVTDQLCLTSYKDAIDSFPPAPKSSWPSSWAALCSGIDGFYRTDDDACTERDNGGWAREIIIFRYSLYKLGHITLLDAHRA